MLNSANVKLMQLGLVLGVIELWISFAQGCHAVEMHAAG